MDAREEISRWLALLVQLSSEAESDQIDGDIKMLTGVTQQLSSELAKRNTDLAKQCRRNKPAIAKKLLRKALPSNLARIAARYSRWRRRLSKATRGAVFDSARNSSG